MPNFLTRYDVGIGVFCGIQPDFKERMVFISTYAVPVEPIPSMPRRFNGRHLDSEYVGRDRGEGSLGYNMGGSY